MSKELEITALDAHFARFIANIAAGDEVIYRSAALVSMAARNGHSCLELREWAGNVLLEVSGQDWSVPDQVEWESLLLRCLGVGSGPGATPLVMEDGRLYLRRYWEYEEEVVRGLLSRGRAACLPIDEFLLASGLERCIPAGVENEGQRLAVLLAMLRPLAVITGGPGTGKTTIVALLLRLLAEQYPERDGGLRVALAAPTGKAAMRMQEAISRINMQLSQERSAEGFPPAQVMTVHRLLGAVGRSVSFRHDENNPLPYDLVVVDEVSMVDLPMMAKLLRALKPSTRLVLLGDRHQLASIEPGSVLGDLCDPSALAGFSRDFLGRLKGFGVSGALWPTSDEAIGFGDSLVELRRSHRFGGDSGIGRLGTAVKVGDLGGVWEVLDDRAFPDVNWREVASSAELGRLLVDQVAGSYADCSVLAPEEALVANERFRVLCGLRQGPFGAEQVNARLEGLLAGRTGGAAFGQNYPGRPVMVLRNDYDLRLYNGDVGVILADTDAAGELKAYFSAPGGGVRKISPARLPLHQTVYAMTVHKSQGSEFDRILLILPERPSPVLSRELLFTAITRARLQVEIWGRRQVLEEAVARSGERHSGLRRKLWGDKSDVACG